MTQVIDWEAQIEEIRSKATAAARHSERMVSGVAQSLAELSSQRKVLSDIAKSQVEISNRLGSLERFQKGRATQARDHSSVRAGGIPAVLVSGLFGLGTGVVVSGVFFWN